MHDWNTLAAPFADVCVAESGANPIIAQNLFAEFQLLGEEHVQCYIKCLLQKYHVLTDDGVFDEDEIIKKIEHLTRDIADVCLEKHGNVEDLCKKSYLLAENTFRVATISEMKLFVVLSLVIMTSAANKLQLIVDLMHDWNTLAARFADECVAESGANPIIAQNMFADFQLLGEEHVQCYIKCLLQRYEVLTDDGVFHVEAIIKLIEHVSQENADVCLEKHGQVKDLCKQAYLLAVPPELAEDWNQLAGPYVEECKRETDVDPALTTNLFKNDKLHDEEHFRCYFACLMIKRNFLDRSGNLNKEMLLKHVKHLSPEIYDKCFERFGSEEHVCKKGYRFSMCTAEENYIAENGSIKPDKHLELGLVIKSPTGSRKVINISNRLGQYANYSLIEELENKLSYVSK
ncbi:hypothetical protein FQR65_LT12151 [Abscondita terminalis]|nr:hypothetical protein FQR65_LT12151 [Abscondita terminalis]